jgi:hypothetical protein
MTHCSSGKLGNDTGCVGAVVWSDLGGSGESRRRVEKEREVGTFG